MKTEADKIDRAPKLTEVEQIEVCRRIAWFWRDPEIVDFIQLHFNKTVRKESVGQYRRSEKWEPIVTKFRDDYNKAILEVPLANKRKRLDELQKLFNIAMDHNKYREARDIIHSFREEMEAKLGDVNFHFTQITNNEFKEMSDEQIQQEKVKTLEQLEKVRSMKRIAHGGEDG